MKRASKVRGLPQPPILGAWAPLENHAGVRKMELLVAFLGCEMLDKILQECHLPYVQFYKLHSAAPGAELVHGHLGNLHIVDDLAFHLVDVNKTSVAPKYFDSRAICVVIAGAKIPDAQSVHADVDDIAEVDEFPWPEECRESPFLSPESFVLSSFFGHFRSIQKEFFRSGNECYSPGNGEW